MSDVSDRLEVKVKEVDKLPLVNFLMPNPYAAVTIGFDTQQTGHVVEKQTAVFSFPAMIFSSLIANNVDFMTITIYSRDLLGNNHIKLGVIHISLDTVYHSPNIELEDWYVLTPLIQTPDIKTNSCGRIRVAMSYWTSEINLGLAKDPDAESQPAPNMLEVRIISGEDIGVKYSNLEAFVEIQVGDIREISKVRLISVTLHS